MKDDVGTVRQFVITRPRDEAGALAADLTARGYLTAIEPMLEIVPMPATIPPLEDYKALIFTSANGVRAFCDRSGTRALPAYAVGIRTADSLRRAGFNDVRGASGDAEALALFIGETLAEPGPVLHIAGNAVARDLETLLDPAGIPVDRLTLYDAVAAERFSEALIGALYARTISGVLFFSARTAGTFGTLLRKHGLADMIDSISAYCLSDQVGAALTGLSWRNIAVADRPTAQSLVALLPVAETIHGR